MKHPKKRRGDSTLFVRGVDRRDFMRQVSTSCAAGMVALSILETQARSVNVSRKNGRIMLQDLSYELFAEKLGATFEARLETTAMALELVEARLLTTQPNRPASLAQRAPFAIVFRAPAGTKAPQQIYEVRHPEVGAFGIFLVPIGPDEKGPRYEAIFN